MKILISGSGGFVGSNLVDHLDQNYPDIDKVFLSTVGQNKPGECIYWDELESYQGDQLDIIIHLAGKAHDTRNVSSQKEYYEVNFGLTRRIYDFFLRSNATKFLFISSVKAVSDGGDLLLDETVLPAPLTHYGRSKRMAEEYIIDQPIPNGKKFFIFRPCMIHGQGNKGNLNLLYKFVSKGLPWPLGAFSNLRSFLSIDNLIFCLEEVLMREDIPSGIYHVADDVPLSTNRLVEIIAEELGRPNRIISVNKQVVTFLAKLGDTLQLPIDSETLRKLTENYVLDNTKIRAALQKPLPIGAEEGVRQTIRSFSLKE